MIKTQSYIYMNSPKIQSIDDFVPKNLCNSLIRKFDKNLNESKVTDGLVKTVSDSRSASMKFIANNENTIKPIVSNLCSYHKWDLDDIENVQFARYQKGEEYKPHYDAFDKKYLEKIDKKQRIITSIIYLNDNFSGGQTSFPKLDIQVKPKQGMMLSFENCLKDTNFLNPFMLHSSEPIEDGQKFILTFWLCSK